MGVSGPAASFQANYLMFSGTVNGNMQVTAGNGDNDLDGLLGQGFTGTVTGNVSFYLGNGNDTVTITNAPLGKLTWISGNGSDSVQLGEAATPTAPGQVWNVYVRFGTGSDTLTLGGDPVLSNPEYITGFVDMGGPPGGNTFTQGTNWIVLSPFTLQNV